MNKILLLAVVFAVLGGVAVDIGLTATGWMLGTVAVVTLFLAPWIYDYTNKQGPR